MSFEVAADHPIFAGPFSRAARSCPASCCSSGRRPRSAVRWAARPRELRVREVKFFAPLEPGQRAQLRFDPPASGATRCAFDIRRDAAVVARGTLEWSARDGA